MQAIKCGTLLALFCTIPSIARWKHYPFPEDGYHGDYIIEIAQELIDLYGNKFAEDNADNLAFFQKYGEEWNFKRIKSTLERLNVFKIFIIMKTLCMKSGKIEQIAKWIEKKQSRLWIG